MNYIKKLAKTFRNTASIKDFCKITLVMLQMFVVAILADVSVAKIILVFQQFAKYLRH